MYAKPLAHSFLLNITSILTYMAYVALLLSEDRQEDVSPRYKIS